MYTPHFIRKAFCCALLLGFPFTVQGIYATEQEAPHRFSVMNNPFLDNWFVHAGVDMSLQNPHGYSFKHVFPNGRSFGIDAAIGKRFSPALAARVKINWENGIINSKKALWLAPFGEGGRNHDMGGYLSFVGDIPLDLHAIFRGYDPERLWSTSLYPRAGAVYNFGTKKGAPLVGFGWANNFRINHRISLYLDIAYQMVSSGFTMDEKTNTGTGNSSNGYFDINAGVQVDLGSHEFHRGNEEPRRQDAVWTNSFWSNWYVQAGLGCSFQKPYKYKFIHTIPNGTSMGINVAMGKWFTPEVGLRAGINWQNGIIPNGKLEWVAPFGPGNKNYGEGGFGAAYIEMPLSVTNMIMGYHPERFWNISVFPRAGIVSNFAVKSASPLIGAGAEATFHLHERLSLYVDLAYQMTTSEFVDGTSWTGPKGMGSNGFMDLNVGIQVDLGRSRGLFRQVR